MTSYEDRTLVCTDCQAEFVFTAGEQEFFAEKGLTSEPKRCKNCRSTRKKQKHRSKGKGDGIYRSPAFEGSAPAHQKIRGRRGFQQRGRGEYRSPGLNERGLSQGEYRSPAFRDIDVLTPEQEYRSPGFREYENIDPKEEYRSPGFSEYADINLREEYRAPGFQDMSQKYKDEKPMFSIVCSACGQEAMIPILPDEDKPIFCKSCYAIEREKRRAEREAAQKADAETETETAAAVEPTESATETTVPSAVEEP